MKIMIVALTICVSLGCACGLLKGNKISNEQINADLGNQALKVTEGSPNIWDFKKANERCFKITESKYAEGKAEITAEVSSFYSDKMDARIEDVQGKQNFAETAVGEIVLNYKNEDGKWVFEKAESKKMIAKTVSYYEFFNIFLRKHFEYCDNFKHSNK